MGQWQNFTLTAPGQPGITPGNDIAVVSRIPNHVEVFYITEDGSIWDYYWYGLWNNFQLRPPHSAVMGGITAVSRRPQNMAVFWVSDSESIESAQWEDGRGWFYERIAPAGSVGIHSKVISLSRHSDNVELFYMGKYGSIESMAYNGAGWHQSQISPDDSATILYSGLTAVSRQSEAVEVWWVSRAGSVEGAWRWGADPKWNRYQIAHEGSAAVEGATLRAQAKQSDLMNMWWISPKGSVEGCWTWLGKVPWTRYQIAGDGSANTNGDIFSLHRYNQITEEIWWIRKDGAIMDAYWYEGMDNWNVFELAPPGSAKPYGSIYGASRDIGIMDIFYERMDGKIQSYWLEFKRKDFSYSPGGASPGDSRNQSDLTITDDGVVRWKGESQNLLSDSYNFSTYARCYPTSQSGLSLLIAVNSSHASPHGDNSWYDVRRNGFLITYFTEFVEKKEQFDARMWKWKNLQEVFVSNITLDMKMMVGADPGKGAVFVFVGADLASFALTDNLAVGRRLINGSLYLAGFENTLIGICGDSAASVGSKDRQITQAEYDWANDQVFRWTLPPREKIYLTDAKAVAGRAFTLPHPNGGVSINVGGYPGFYDNPTDPRFAALFIEQLTRAWQVKYAGFEFNTIYFSLPHLTKSLASQLAETHNENLEPPTQDFSLFDPGKQAYMVRQWWASGTTEIERLRNPYSKYITYNIRLGRLKG